MALNELLGEYFLGRHPFATYTAEAEIGEIAGWFIDPPFLPAIMGDIGPGELMVKSSLIFGSPGDGETALRLRMERELLKRPDVLVLRYINFSRPLASGGRPKLTDHVEELLRIATAGLVAMCHDSKERQSRLDVATRCEFLGLINRYYSSLSPYDREKYVSDNPIAGRAIAIGKVGVKALVDAYNAAISVLNREKVEPTDWTTAPSDGRTQADPVLTLERFWHLAKALGIASVWVFVDRIDEAPIDRIESSRAIFDCVAELLLSQPILEFREQDRQVLCFKIFLTRPGEIGPLLERNQFRKDRIERREIKWRREELKSALIKRLAHFSKERVISFDEICDPTGFNVQDRLLDECGSNPRTLFRMASEIFGEFQRRNLRDMKKLDRESIEAGIRLALQEVVR